MKIRTWIYFFKTSLINISNERLIHLISMGTITIAMLLLGSFLLLYTNLDNWIRDWGESLSMSVYLKDGIDEEAKKEIETALTSFKGAEIISSRACYEELANENPRMMQILMERAPGMGEVGRTAGREGEPSASEQGYLHCGPVGAGHFVKMVHNGIEYGLMAAYAEGLNILKHANVGKASQEVDAETSPLRNPEDFQYDLNLAEITEVWRRGSVVASWLLDLTADALYESPELSEFAGRVSDSGEGRWTSIAAIESGAPARVLTTALYDRFTSRGESDFGDKVLSAMRFGFGGHHEKK